MSVQKAYIDYLRLAAWDDSEAMLLTAELRRSIPKWRHGFWLQYHGWYGDQSFYGIGEQNDKRHFVWRTSGSSSAVLFGMSKMLVNVYCTRIDVQVTIKMPTEYDPFTTYKAHQGEGRLGVTIMQSPTGSTIYFGSRTSDKFARLYEKQYEDGKYLRLEFEFKGKLARAVHAKMRDSSVGPTACFQYYFMVCNRPRCGTNAIRNRA
jgi:hypothetical protein